MSLYIIALRALLLLLAMVPRPRRGAPKGNQNARKYPKVEPPARSADGHEELTVLRGARRGTDQSGIADTSSVTATASLDTLLKAA